MKSQYDFRGFRNPCRGRCAVVSVECAFSVQFLRIFTAQVTRQVDKLINVICIRVEHAGYVQDQCFYSLVYRYTYIYTHSIYTHIRMYVGQTSKRKTRLKQVYLKNIADKRETNKYILTYIDI